jgi:hypothetical protein
VKVQLFRQVIAVFVNFSRLLQFSEILENFRIGPDISEDFLKFLAGNPKCREFPEISGNFQKFSNISQIKQGWETMECFRKFLEISGNILEKLFLTFSKI